VQLSTEQRRQQSAAHIHHVRATRQGRCTVSRPAASTEGGSERKRGRGTQRTVALMRLPPHAAAIQCQHTHEQLVTGTVPRKMSRPSIFVKCSEWQGRRRLCIRYAHGTHKNITRQYHQRPRVQYSTVQYRTGHSTTPLTERVAVEHAKHAGKLVHLKKSAQNSWYSSSSPNVRALRRHVGTVPYSQADETCLG
jgi:hypothetical protein